MSEPEITNPKKTKNPKHVEQGKRLAAISREVKERKKQQQEKFFESTEDEGNKIFFGIGLIGATFLIYKIFLNSKEHRSLAEEVQDEVSVDPPTEPVEPTEPAETPEPPNLRKPRSFKPYAMD